jgi:subtilisin family serine protease
MTSRVLRFGWLLLVSLLTPACGEEELPVGRNQEANEPFAVSPSRSARYIVVLKDDVNEPLTRLNHPSRFALGHGVTPKHVYEHALRGFSAQLSKEEVTRLRQDPRVDFVQPDGIAYARDLPANRNGLARMGGLLGNVAKVDGTDERVDVGIAILDTGIGPHTQLNIAGGVNCIGGTCVAPPTGTYADDNGHGTHVAGIAAAIDNGSAMAGVAPGAPLYAVKVLDSTGTGAFSDIIAGVNWVAARASTIRVANLSLGTTYTPQEPHATCAAITEAFHRSICNLEAATVTVVVAAGNERMNAALDTPGGFHEVISVAALADFDGQQRGGAAPSGYSFCLNKSCNKYCTISTDDTFACFSNYGPDVTLLAPGIAIWSTLPNNTYGEENGTSMASPHVAGAAALYLATHPGAAPAAVKAGLVAAADAKPCGTALGAGGTACIDPVGGTAAPLAYVGVVEEPFAYGDGAAPSRLVGPSSGGNAAVTIAGGVLHTAVTGQSTTDPDFATAKVCLWNPTSDYLSATFKIKFERFGGWDAIGIATWPDTESPWRYWWWVDGNGRVFDNQDRGTPITAGGWLDGKITINRMVTPTVASLKLGSWEVTGIPLSNWNPPTDGTEPIQCLMLYVDGDTTPHYVELEDVVLRARP